MACWGWNSSGRVGDGSFEDRLAPTAVMGLLDVVRITAGGSQTCALRSDGRVSCWGGNEAGQLGDDTFLSVRDGGRSSPVTVVDLSDATVVAAGAAHSCAVKSDGTVVCWGWNERGQLGDGTTTNRPAPRAVRGL
jgi:hypothetical protein